MMQYTRNLRPFNRQKQSDIIKSSFNNKKLINEIEKQKSLYNIKKEELLSKKIKCPFLELCEICINSSILHCCLLRRLHGEIPSKACNEINCISNKDCERAIHQELVKEEIPDINLFLKNTCKIRKPLDSFSEYYYPVLQIENKYALKKQLDLIKKLKSRGIVISLQKIFSPNEEYFIKEYYYQDLHDFLEYYDEIILTTNIEDRYCKILIDRAENIPKMLKKLNPDVITTFDANFYLDQPSFIQLIQLDKIFKTNDRISDSTISQIGLVPPIPAPLFKIALLSQLNKNHKTIAIPLQEINKYRNRYSVLNHFRQEIVDSCLLYHSEFKFKYILLSTSPNKGVYANSFSSMNWLSKIGEFHTIEKIWRQREKNLKEYQIKAKKHQPKYQSKLVLDNFVG